MIIQCPSCKARYRIDEKKTGKSVARVKCPKCDHGFQVRLEPAGSGAQRALDSGLIVVVDDARFFREVIADILAPLERRLLQAGSGEEGLALVRQHRPALVILDLKLPGLSGYELIEALRGDAALTGLKILAMSSVFRQDEEVRRVLQAGADEFLNKSFKPEHLLGRVRRLLES